MREAAQDAEGPVVLAPIGTTMKYPFVRQVLKRGKARWVADLRRFGKGRKFYANKTDAEQACDIHYSGEGIAEEERNEYLHLRDRLKKAGATFSQAVDYFLANKPTGTARLEFALNECISEKKAANRNARYLQQLRYSVEAFINSVEVQECHESTVAHVNAWLHKKNPQWSPRTKMGRLVDLRTFFTFCKRKGWMAANPTELIEPIVVEDKPPGILTVLQCEQLLNTAARLKPWMVPYIALGMFCGIRPEEIQKLTWKQVDLETLLVEVPAKVSKTRRRRLVSISKNAAKWLKQGGELPPVNAWERMRTIRTEAGIKKWPHDALRHSFASYHLAEFKDAAKTSHELGHWNTETLYRHYRELVKPADAKKFWSISPP